MGKQRLHLSAVPVLTLFLFAGSLGSATAQVVLSYSDTPRSGVLPPGGQPSFTLFGVTGDVVLLRVARSTGDFWPRIRLLDPAGNDVAPPQRDVPSVELVARLSTTGPHTILISDGLNGTLSGAFTVLAQRLNPPVGACALSPGPVQPGKIAVPGAIASCTFTGCAGARAILRASRTSGDFWPRIRLFDQAGKQLADVRNVPSAELDVFLPANGPFAVVAADGLNGTLTGEFNLTLTLVGQGGCWDVAALSFDAPAVPGCKPTTGVIVLSGPAPAPNGAEVLLGTTGPASAPPSVTVRVGDTRAAFPITTQPVTDPTPATITARSASGNTVSATLLVLPIGVGAVSLARDTVRGGEAVSATTSLECSAAPGDVIVTLSSSDPTIASPVERSITIPRDRIGSEAFMVITRSVSVRTPVTIYATANGSTQGFTLMVTP